MGFRYAVIGAGRMGLAAAYDLAQFGEADEVILIDANHQAAEEAAARVNQLLERQIATGIKAEVGDANQLKNTFDGITSIISAVPYSFNIALTELAIELGANLCDLGGHTGIVRQQLEYDTQAKDSDISIVPDCGMGPGMNISLATYAMGLVDKPREVYIWDGGLPQEPKPPWNYALTFNIGGLTNEYYGNATFLRDGELTEVPCFEGFEELEFPPPLGQLEAFVTSGGLSTMPWTYKGKLERLENKTLRYPGHCAQFKTFAKLGLLELEPIHVGNVKITPREVLHALLEPHLIQPDVHDVCVIRVKCSGKKDGHDAEANVELIDYYDEPTGFTAMQRLTGWHASIVAIQAAKGKISHGAIPIELAVPGEIVVAEARRRGFDFQEQVRVD